MIINKIYKIIINRIKYHLFLLNEKISGDPINKKLEKVSKISSYKERSKKLNDLFNKYSSHLMVSYVTANSNISGKDPKLGFEQIKDYNTKRDNWFKQNPNTSVYKNEFVPICRVIGSFGNYRTLFYYLMNKLNSEKIYKKPNLLLKEHEKINNTTLYSYFKPYMNIIQNTSLFYKLKNFSQIFKAPIEIALPYNGYYYPWFAVENITQQKLSTKNNLKFTKFNLSEEHFKKGKEILKKIGLPENAWYVTLHIREGAQNEKTFNSDPLTYLKSIKEIISRGGYVFRVGDNKMQKMPKIKGLIDYPFTEFKSEFMDVFLGATCRFVIGTSSGYWTVPIYFGKPALLVNYLPILDYYSLGTKNIFLGKHLKNKKTGKKVSIEKLFNFNIGYLTEDNQYEDQNIEIIDNDENEIWESTVEILNLTNNTEMGEEFIKLNSKFREKVNLKNEKLFDFKIKALANISSAYLRKYVN